METFIIVIYFLVLGILALYGFHRALLLFLYWRHRKSIPQPQTRFADLPKVTVQLPMFNEMYVAERLLESVSSLDYPHDKLEIQVLDDSTDETTSIVQAKVNELKERGLNVKYLHRVDRIGYKAGALDAGQKVAEGDFPSGS